MAKMKEALTGSKKLEDEKSHQLNKTASQEACEKLHLKHKCTGCIPTGSIRPQMLEILQQEKSELQGKLKKEKNLGMQVQMNTKIKQIKENVESLKIDL